MIDGNTEYQARLKKWFGHDDSRKACFRGVFMVV